MKIISFLLLAVYYLAGCTSIEETASPPPPSPQAPTSKTAPAPKNNLLATLGIEIRPDAPPISKKRILIPQVTNKSLYGGTEIPSLATQKLKDFFAGQPEYLILSDSDLDSSMVLTNEFGDFVVPEALKAAKAKGAAGVILGTVTDLSIRHSGDEVGLFRMRKYGINATIKIELWDASTNRPLFSQNYSADVVEEHTELFKNRSPSSYDGDKGKVAVSKALDKAVVDLPNFAKKLGWSGKIAKTESHRYFINAGEMTGITRGQLLKVFDEGNPIYDPESHQFLGMAPGRFKGLLKVIDFFGSDGAVAVVHSGGNFREKDRVEVFNP